MTVAIVDCGTPTLVYWNRGESYILLSVLYGRISLEMH